MLQEDTLDIGFENLLVLLIFVLPGFLTDYVRQTRTPIDKLPPKRTLFDKTLLSIVTSLEIFFLQGIILYFLISWSDFIKGFAISLINGELVTYAISNPLNLIANTIIWLLIILLSSVFFSYADPIQYLVNFLNKRSGKDRFLVDQWFYLFDKLPKQLNMGKSKVTVWLKSGAVYEGFMGGYEHSPDPEKVRLFWLYNAMKWNSHESFQNGEQGELRNVSLLKDNEDIISMDIAWVVQRPVEEPTN